MANIVILTSHSPWTYGLVNTLIARGCVPIAVVFEGGLRNTWAMRCVRFLESAFLALEHAFFFRRHRRVHDLYRRHGSVARLLRDHGIDMHVTANHNDPDAEAFLKKISPDYVLLCGTRIIKPNILSIPKRGALNAHSAMLPKFRGAKSEYWILESGETDAAGVTVHWVEPTLDTGAICLQEKIPVDPRDTTKTLRAKSVYLGAHLFAETIRRIENGEELRTVQSGGEEARKRPSPEDLRRLDAEILAGRRR